MKRYVIQALAILGASTVLVSSAFAGACICGTCGGSGYVVKSPASTTPIDVESSIHIRPRPPIQPMI